MIQIVVVLYKTTLENCSSYNSFKACAGKLTVPYDIMVVNNHPDTKVKEGAGYKVYTPTANLMLAGAYNKALVEAKANGHKWILLLDQDTVVTEEYVKGINEALTNDVPESIAAIVPIVRQVTNNIQISPATYNPSWGIINMHMLGEGVVSSCASAINSCAVLRVEAIEGIGGFPEKYPLDGLDIMYFYYLYQKGWSVQVIEPVIYQNLSVYDYKNSMSMTRYQSIIRSELDMTREMGWRAMLTMKMRYCVRVLKQLANTDKRKYALTTFKSIFSK